MEFAWILIGLAGWAIGIFLVMVIVQVAGDQEDAAYRSERDMTLKPKTPVAKPGSHAQTGDRQ